MSPSLKEFLLVAWFVAVFGVFASSALNLSAF